jgi:hypothetical protein
MICSTKVPETESGASPFRVKERACSLFALLPEALQSLGERSYEDLCAALKHFR